MPTTKQQVDVIGQVLSTLSTGKAGVSSSSVSADSPSIVYAGQLIGAIQKSAMLAPKLVSASSAASPLAGADKSLWGDITGAIGDAVNIATQVAPYVVQLFGKDYASAGSAIAAAGVSPSRYQDKNWLLAVNSLLTQVVPEVLQLFSGQKAFQQPLNLPSPPAGEPDLKAWYNDLISGLSTALPYVIRGIAMIA